MEPGGKHDAKPSVDDYLTKLENSASSLDDGLRIVAARVARSMYTLRNKRNIAHKGTVDPNTYDLGYLHHASQWVIAEFLRNASGITMEEAGRLVDLVQEPVGGLVEDLGGHRLFLKDTTAKDEALILLQDVYPKALTLEQLTKSMDRRSPDTVRKALRKLWNEKVVDGNAAKGYQLTKKGVDNASEATRRLVASDVSKQPRPAPNR